MPKCSIVDLGGGFPGSDEFSAFRNLPTFKQLSVAIKDGIEKHFADLQSSGQKVDFIAEPGRYMVASSGYLATKVYARKGGKSDRQALYIDDGVYGSFNHLIYEHAVVQPKLFHEVEESEKSIPTQIFGPTCDGMDQICEEQETAIPRVEINDWLFWDEMGAYTHCGSFVFNGYTNIPAKSYVRTTLA